MVSRLHKAINRQRWKAFSAALKKYKGRKEYTIDYDSTEPETARDRSLPYPRKLVRINQPHTGGWSTATPTTGRIITDSRGSHSMMDVHCLWVRVFDKHDELLFNHVNSQVMHTSQMIHLCTRLVNHLNLISQTNELEVQKALGTFEGTIIAQLTPPLDGKAQYHSWNAQHTDNMHHDVGAITIIRQDENSVFSGQLVDDHIGATFHIE